MTTSINFSPLTADRWADFEKLFGARGACGGCWCMYWRLSRTQFEEQKGELNRRNMQAIVNAGEVPGIVAYVDDQPVGWCAIAPRSDFPVLGRSRVLKPLDDQPVWSVVCFFVAKPYRRQGLMVSLLQAAVAYAGGQGARIIEGYPVELKQRETSPVFIFTGLASAFQKAGFIEVARRSETRPMMRFTITS